MREITVEKDATRIVIYARGKLTGSLVSELENCWKNMSSVDTRNPIRLDLGGVTFADKNAKALLSEMVVNGVQFQADGPRMTSVAEQFISDTDSRPDNFLRPGCWRKRGHFQNAPPYQKVYSL